MPLEVGASFASFATQNVSNTRTVVFTIGFCGFGAGGLTQGASCLCGLRYGSVNHRVVGVSRSDLAVTVVQGVAFGVLG